MFKYLPLSLMLLISPSVLCAETEVAPKSINTLLHSQQEMRVAIEAEALKWLKAQAHPFEMDKLDAASLSPLVKELSSARVVGIGEVTHGTHEDSAFKSALMQATIMQGDIAYVAFELNRTTGERLNSFVAPDSQETDAVKAMQEAHVYKVWMTEDFAKLLLWLKDWNRSASKKIKIIGVDVQDTSRDLQFALDIFSKHDATTAKVLQEKLALLLTAKAKEQHIVVSVQGMTHSQWEATVRAAGELQLALAALQEDADINSALSATSAAIAGLQMFEYDSTEADFANMSADYYGIRDVAMADRLLQEVPTTERVLFWAHDDHVLRLEITPGFDSSSVGTRLNEKLGPKAYQVVNFTFEKANLHAENIERDDKSPVGGKSAPVEWSIHVVPGDLGELTARAGVKNYWVSLTSLPNEQWPWAWVNIPYERHFFGWGFSEKDFTSLSFPVGIHHGFDILVHIQQLSASQRLPDLVKAKK